MTLQNLKKYILLIVALIIFIIGTIFYLCIDTVAMSVGYMFIIFVVISLLTYYFCFNKSE